MTDFADGWNALRMRCQNCEPSGQCDTCNGTGWHPNSHTINDGLFIGGNCVAKVEAFYDRGPLYQNAVDPDGNHHRAVRRSTDELAEAKLWCERIAGFHPMREGDARPIGGIWNG